MTTHPAPRPMPPSVPLPRPPRPPRHSTASIVLGLATLTTGLMAGVYYAYACSVMLGLARTSDRTFIDVMQQINVAIQNPVFFAAFFGALACTALACVQQRRLGRRDAMRWVIAALVCSTAGVIITMSVNGPLNEQLAAAGDPARIMDPAAVRHHFETPWMAWNIIRAAATAAALGCLARALVVHGRGPGAPASR